MAEILAVDRAMARALALLRAGEIVALPTETVYGLAGDAANGQAVARIFEAKGRPRFNPLIAHVSTMPMAETLARFDPLSRRLADRFWPGPLTLVLPLVPDAPVHPLVTGGLDTVALRMPVGFARDLIGEFGRPLAAPSANASGRISATSAAAVEAGLGGRIKLIVDGGPSTVGLESTIVKVEDGRLRLLRPGAIGTEALAPFAELVRAGSGAVESPGMLASHYAPRARLRIDAREVRAGEALLAFGPDPVLHAALATETLNLSPSGNLREAAANLFAYLAVLDAGGASTIAAASVPRNGLGEAINDRLARAAAPRPEFHDA